jgi:hypothetical protein
MRRFEMILCDLIILFSLSTVLCSNINLHDIWQEIQTQDVLQTSSCPSTLTNVVDSELQHQTQHKVDSINVINNVRFQPLKKFRLLISLCRMISMAKVRLVGEMGIQHLELEFMKGYRDGDRVMYISMYNNEELSSDVTEEVKADWSPCWERANQSFEDELQVDSDLKQFSGKMFYVWEGNHRLAAWLRHINNHHAEDPELHISVHCIILDPCGQVGLLLNAMHDIN